MYIGIGTSKNKTSCLNYSVFQSANQKIMSKDNDTVNFSLFNGANLLKRDNKPLHNILFEKKCGYKMYREKQQ